MIDLHCHILPEVDDGSRSIRETITILRSAVEAGFNTICFTPHYAEPQYVNTKTQNQEILEKVKMRAKIEYIELNLLLGNEIYINENTGNDLEEGICTSLADTKYVLIEVPMYQKMAKEAVQNMLNKVREKGYKIVIAHPERYTYIQSHPSKILQYFGKDVIFQGNYASIIGAYGKESQSTIKKLLKMGVIHFLASDVHHANRCFYNVFDNIKDKLFKVVDEEYFKIITETNPKLIIENKEVIKYEGK